MSIINILGGAALLAFGRRIFWFFVALTGFFAGLQVATSYLHLQPGWTAYAIALLVGLVGALLAIFFQRLAIGVAGFLAGAYLASRFSSQLVTQLKIPTLVIIIVGGVIGLILMYIIFEWALILLSSLAGAILVVDGLKLAGLIAVIAGVFLFVIGIIFQSILSRGTRARKSTA